MHIYVFIQKYTLISTYKPIYALIIKQFYILLLFSVRFYIPKIVQNVNM